MEVWFRILGKPVLNRGHCTSFQDWQQQMEPSLASDNKRRANAWKWSVRKTRDIPTLIEKIMRREGVLDSCECVA
jgi:hypothetical protein